MQTIVHLLRHGEVHNPEGVLYGRRPGYHLSDLGRRMAARVAESLAGRDIVHLGASPLERARETAAPLAEVTGLEVRIDPRLIESTNVFEGKAFGAGDATLKHPKNWRHLRNPLKPSWGEPYTEVVDRVLGAILTARQAAHGHEAVLVSHQLPIWITRLSAEKRSFLHDPRKRQCTLCSLTSFHFDENGLVQVSYSEPAGDLIPVKDRNAAFSTGGAPEEHQALKRPLAVLACLPLLMGVTACNNFEGTGDKGYVSGDGVISEIAVDQRDEPVSFDGEDLDGAPLSLDQSRGKPTVVVVWGSWCTECIAEAEDVEAAAEALKGKADFVGINLRDGSTAQANGYVREFGIDYPSFYSPDGAATLAFSGLLGPHTIPAFVVLDAEGRVAASIIGRLPSTQTLVDLATGTTDG